MLGGRRLGVERQRLGLRLWLGRRRLLVGRHERGGLGDLLAVRGDCCRHLARVHRQRLRPPRHGPRLLGLVGVVEAVDELELVQQLAHAALDDVFGLDLAEARVEPLVVGDALVGHQRPHLAREVVVVALERGESAGPALAVVAVDFGLVLIGERVDGRRDLADGLVERLEQVAVLLLRSLALCLDGLLHVVDRRAVLLRRLEVLVILDVLDVHVVRQLLVHVLLEPRQLVLERVVDGERRHQRVEVLLQRHGLDRQNLVCH